MGAALHNEPVTRFLTALLLASAPLAASDDPIQRGRALYDAARQAATGGQTLHDLSYNRVTELERQGRKLQIQSAVQVVLPSASRVEIASPAGTTVLVYDGNAVINRSAGGQALPQQAADLQRRELARAFALFGPEPAPGTVRYRGEGEVDGRPVQIIELFDVGDTPLRLFLDSQTHDVRKRMYVGDAPDGTMAQVEEVLSDHKTIGGFRWPHAMKTTRNGKPGPASTFSGVRVNQGLAAAEITE